ncbi:MAG: GYDIA family GHMP kinase [Nonlabens sp.]
MSTDHITYSANGKFLITGEYAVLNNVPALAVPLKKQQHFELKRLNSSKIIWKSHDGDGSLWMNFETVLKTLFSDHKYRDATQAKLAEILRTARKLKPQFDWTRGFEVATHLDFNREFGMGTSSTLISFIAYWTGCNPYTLQFACFQGSGFDIACATAEKAIIYNYNDALPLAHEIEFQPEIADELFFVYLNQKQNSRESISKFDKSKLTSSIREELSAMPQKFVDASCNRTAFEKVMTSHEEIISELVNIPPVKQRLFPDFPNAIKSLGGWGGDFVLATGSENDHQYFKKKGYQDIFRWSDLVRG